MAENPKGGPEHFPSLRGLRQPHTLPALSFCHLLRKTSNKGKVIAGKQPNAQ